VGAGAEKGKPLCKDKKSIPKSKKREETGCSFAIYSDNIAEKKREGTRKGSSFVAAGWGVHKPPGNPDSFVRGDLGKKGGSGTNKYIADGLLRGRKRLKLSKRTQQQWGGPSLVNSISRQRGAIQTEAKAGSGHRSPEPTQIEKR